MGFNQCYLRSVKDLESELEYNGLELFVNRYRKYDSLTGSSESFAFLEQKIIKELVSYVGNVVFIKGVVQEKQTSHSKPREK